MFFRRVKTKLFRDLAVQISSFTSTKHLSCTVPNSQIVSTFLIIIITFSSTCDLIYIIFPRFNLVLYSLRTKESIPHKTPNYLGDPPTGYVSPQKKIWQLNFSKASIITKLQKLWKRTWKFKLLELSANYMVKFYPINL